MTQLIRFAIVDDHEIVRSGISKLLNNQPDMECLAEYGSGAELKEALLLGPQPHVLLVDIKLPDISGIELASWVKSNFPHMGVLAISVYDDEEFIRRMLAVGVNGYLFKNASAHELAEAVRAAAIGQQYYSSGVALQMVNKYLRSGMSNRTLAAESKTQVNLTRRELEILHFICLERTNVEIADKLSISRRTVENHRRNIMQKVGARNNIGLMKYALSAGFAQEVLVER